jgi:predicted component of type VI protein secretion system
LQRPVILIGRHPECDIRLDAPQISRRHCCIALAYDRIMIRDLGSRHGVLVNGRAVEETSLNPGDEIALAQFIYRFEPDTAPSPPPPPVAVKPAKPQPAAPPTPLSALIDEDDEDLEDLIPIEL